MCLTVQQVVLALVLGAPNQQICDTTCPIRTSADYIAWVYTQDIVWVQCLAHFRAPHGFRLGLSALSRQRGLQLSLVILCGHPSRLVLSAYLAECVLWLTEEPRISSASVDVAVHV